MSQAFLGTIRLVGFNFAPVDWALCQGQLLPISQNSALFSLLGTYFGGDGQQNFALPDLRGRVAISQGQGPGLSNYTQGQTSGVETVTLNSAQVPAHTHTMMAATNVTGYNPGPGLALGTPAPLEGTGFEPLVPLRSRHNRGAGPMSPIPSIRVALLFPLANSISISVASGTSGSNPLSSSAESANFRSLPRSHRVT